MGFSGVCCCTLVCAAAWIVSEAAQGAVSVNVVSGITASDEYCLSAGGEGSAEDLGEQCLQLLANSCIFYFR